MTETQVLNLIMEIAEKHASKRAFAIYDADDIKQECFLIAVEALEKYNGVYPLENYLRVSILNRLKNFHRKYNKKELPIEVLGETPLEVLLTVENTDIPEIDDIIDNNLDSYLREDYLKYVNNVKIPKNREAHLLGRLKEILDEYWKLHNE